MSSIDIRLLDRLTELEESIVSIRDKLDREITKNVAKDISIRKLIKANEELTSKVEDLEIKLIDLNQYGRRECIDISNISERIGQHRLEDYVLEVLKEVGVTVTKRDLMAVHRLGKRRKNGNRNVIVKFVNRKDARTALSNKSKLGKSESFKALRIRENLCPERRSIFNRLYKMLMNDEIDDLWTNSGNVYCVFHQDEEATTIQVAEDIDYYLNQIEQDNNSNNHPNILNTVPEDAEVSPKPKPKSPKNQITVQNESPKDDDTKGNDENVDADDDKKDSGDNEDVNDNE